MRGYTGGVQAGTQGIGQAIGLMAQQKAAQQRMDFDAEQQRMNLEAQQKATQEKRQFDIEQQRRDQDLEAAKAGLRRRTAVTNQEDVDKARWDAGVRVMSNPAARLADSGAMGVPGVPAGALTAMELGKTMRDPRNQEQRTDVGWERDPDYVDPDAKPAPTALTMDQTDKYRIRATANTLKPPILDKLDKMLLATDNPQEISLAKKFIAENNAYYEQMKRDYESALNSTMVRLMEQDIKAGVVEAPLIQKALQGMGFQGSQQARGPTGREDEAAGMSFDDAMNVDLDDPSMSPEMQIAALEAAEKLDREAEAMQGQSMETAAPPPPREPGLVNPFPPSEYAEDLDAMRGSRAMPPPAREPAMAPPTQPLPDLGDDLTEDLDAMRGSRARPPVQPTARFPFTQQDIASTVEKMRSAGRVVGQPPPPPSVPVSALGGQPPPPAAQQGGLPPALSALAQSLLAAPRRPPPTQGAADPLAGSALWSGPRAPSPMPPAPAPRQQSPMDVLKAILTGGSNPTGGAQAATPMEVDESGMASVSNPGGSVRLHPTAAKSLRDALNDPSMSVADLESAKISSGYRSPERQQELYDTWVQHFGADRDWPDLSEEEKELAKSLDLHGRPGLDSYHTSGMAIDANTLTPAMLENLMRRGWREEEGVRHKGHFVFGPG